MAGRHHCAVLQLIVCLAAVSGPAGFVEAWWDHGHMLVASTAQALMAPEDIATLNSVLKTLDGPAGGLDEIVSAAVWADQVKCTREAPYCSLPTVPSLAMFTNWHYMSSCQPVNGYPSSANPCPQQDRYDLGLAHIAMASLVQTFETTHSIGTASFSLRMLLHIFGDIHQPLHAMDGVDHNHPGGDVGGNLRTFDPNGCSASNLHALWDSGAGRYTENWRQPGPEWDELRRTILSQGAALAENHTQLAAMDDLGFNRLAGSNWDEAKRLLLEAGGEGLLKQAILESGVLAGAHVYPGLELNPRSVGRVLRCPSKTYFSSAQERCTHRIALAGYRLSFVLTHVAGRLKQLGVYGYNGDLLEPARGLVTNLSPTHSAT